MIFLGIDTSCDDTSIAVLRDRQVLANIISSQDDTHKEYGGVVPILAKR
ncbi:tRNA (adenosine(37)-N6)-threonylcarbamoyltransferase complex transferase subunit TsaD, partial [Candidatus Woesebacteria bacterium]|nr:tRNA (adenosine(37)-N6)-threonylcarbamoyltransferase complex transferase subunit TsaD [Candidatus Woesebacteria bacterium]